MVHIPPKSYSKVLYPSMYMRHSFDTNDFIEIKNQIKDKKLIFQLIESMFSTSIHLILFLFCKESSSGLVCEKASFHKYVSGLFSKWYCKYTWFTFC